MFQELASRQPKGYLQWQCAALSGFAQNGLPNYPLTPA